MTTAPSITQARTSLLGPYVSEQGKNGLLQYKYEGQDHSILAPSMYKIWGLFFKLVPPNTSPNIVTLVGLAIIGSATLWANLSSASDSMKCFTIAIALFLYQTADAVDGMQGKKVGMYQNPTTEMFDHGVDSFVTILTATNMIQFVLGITNPGQALLILFASFAGFHAPTYEHLITSKMIFRGGPTNPTEVLVLGIMVFISAGLFPKFFHGTFGHVLGIVAALSALLSLVSSIRELYTFYKKDLQKTVHSTLRGYLPLFMVGITGFMWLPWNAKFFQQYRILCLLTLAIPWNYAIFRTIINEITGMKNFDTMSVLKGQAPLLIPAVAYILGIPLLIPCIVSLMLSAALYAYTIVVSLREVCDALDMLHFWSIRDERLLNKAQS
jgi:hypothetical protein